MQPQNTVSEPLAYFHSTQIQDKLVMKTQTDPILKTLSIVSRIPCRVGPALQNMFLTRLLVGLSCSASGYVTMSLMCHQPVT